MNYEIITANGLVLLFEWQLHPLANQAIASRMKEDLLLPVKVARDFPDGDMQRFLRSHEKLRRKLHGPAVEKDGRNV